MFGMIYICGDIQWLNDSQNHYKSRSSQCSILSHFTCRRPIVDHYGPPYQITRVGQYIFWPTNLKDVHQNFTATRARMVTIRNKRCPNNSSSNVRFISTHSLMWVYLCMWHLIESFNFNNLKEFRLKACENSKHYDLEERIQRWPMCFCLIFIWLRPIAGCFRWMELLLLQMCKHKLPTIFKINGHKVNEYHKVAK